MSDPTKEEVLASIVPKSDQLNADDLITGPITVTITAVKRGDREQPIVVEIEGHRPYKPCKTMRRVLIATYSDDPKNWVGKQMTLYCDPDVQWGGVKVGGIRISQLSGLTEPKTYLLTLARGKRTEVTIYPIVAPITPVSSEDIDDLLDAINQCGDTSTLANTIINGAVYKRLKNSGPAGDYATVSKLAMAKHAELKGQTDADSGSDETTDPS